MPPEGTLQVCVGKGQAERKGNEHCPLPPDVSVLLELEK